IPLLAAAGTGAFVETLLCSLLSGATLILPEENDPLAVVTQNVTHLRLSAAQWRVLAARFLRAKEPLPESLRTLCIETDSPVPATQAASGQLSADGRVREIFFFSPAGLSGAALRVFPAEQSGPPLPA